MQLIPGIRHFTGLGITGVKLQPFEVSLIPPESAFQRASFWHYQKTNSGHLGVDLGGSRGRGGGEGIPEIRDFTVLGITGVKLHPFEVSLIPPASAFQRASFWHYRKNFSGHLGVDLGKR